jgi:MFS family permease
MTLSSVAPIVAPALGGVMLAWTGTWQPMFYLLAVISLVLAAVSWNAIPETLPPTADTPAGYGRPVGHSSDWPAIGSLPVMH